MGTKIYTDWRLLFMGMKNGRSQKNIDDMNALYFANMNGQAATVQRDEKTGETKYIPESAGKKLSRLKKGR